MTRLLLVEPDVILAGQYQKALEPYFEVAICHDAQGAIVQADKQRPDIIVLEVLLAAHSGIEFLYELRSYPEWQAIPVVVLSRNTAHDLGIDESVLERLAIKAVLYKPETSLKKIVQVLRRITG